MNDYIQLKKRNILKFGIIDEDGKPKKDENDHEIFIEFDLEDITIPDRYNQCYCEVKKAISTLKNDILIINKKQDSKGKGLMSVNEQAKVQAIRKFNKSMEEAMDLFLGKGGTTKIFGETRYLTMFDDLSEMLEPIMPKLKLNMESIESKIRSKYSSKNETVLKDE